MAWTVKIEILNLAEKRFAATGARTDAGTGEVTAYSVVGQYDPALDATQNAARIAEKIFAQHEEFVSDSAGNAAMVAVIETKITTALEGMEA